MSDDPMIRVLEIRDLGLTMDSILAFNNHIQDVCRKAYRSLGFVMRQSARFRGIKAVLALYYAYVRSKLEYNAIVWDPHEAKYSLMLEKVQRKFLRALYKKLYGYYLYLYPSLFVSGMVGLETLGLRRKLALVMNFYLLLNNKVDNPTALAACPLYVPDSYVRLRRLRLMAVDSVRTMSAHHTPLLQALKLINGMMAYYDQTPDVDIFDSNMFRFAKLAYFYLDKT